jgi:hypothetical protein
MLKWFVISCRTKGMIRICNMTRTGRPHPTALFYFDDIGGPVVGRRHGVLRNEASSRCRASEAPKFRSAPVLELFSVDDCQADVFGLSANQSSVG